METSTHTLAGSPHGSTPRMIGRGPALSLTASGLLFLAGAIVHPHAPQARSMAEVAYTQTGEVAWWPAHLLLLAGYAVFAAFLIGVSRSQGLPTGARAVLRVAVPIACFCVLAMFIHLVLPLGRHSVADSHRGWALWAKDFVELADGLWALCVASVAWGLGRTRLVGNAYVASLGVAGGVGFALFSIFVPLTDVVVSMQFTRSLLQVVPVAAILIAAWTLAAGVAALTQRTGVLDSPDFGTVRRSGKLRRK